MRESRPLLFSTDIEEFRSNYLEVPSTDGEEVNDDRTDFEIPNFRYVY